MRNFQRMQKNQTTRGHVAQIHLQEFSLSFSVAEWQISPVPLRFLLFVYYFSTIEICFSCSVRIKFHIKVALFFERSGKHIWICNTPNEIMQLLCEFCFSNYIGIIFFLQNRAAKLAGASQYLLLIPPNGSLQFLKDVNIWTILNFRF